MRKFLLTWYGITDFRASLGFENTDGPIAAALKAEAYSDIVILCYTRADNDSSESLHVQKSFETELASIRNSGLEKDWKATGEFVTRFANTSVAHNHFLGWLKAKAEDRNANVNINIKSEKLRELNDTEGIYACAVRALDWVTREEGEKLVSLYLSPGTPVMAFVWAFAALRFPDLKKRLIASPVTTKPPETISLPAEWLERHRVTQSAIRNASDGLDVTFHLFGEQRMPALLGIRQFESKHHVFVNSPEYPAKCMKAFLKGSRFDELPVDPWDARAVRESIIRHAEALPANSRIGINLTGGTKLMFTGAMAAARALGAVPFYFDSRNRRVTFVDTLYSEPIKPIDSVETYMLLNGDELRLSNKGVVKDMPPNRRQLTESLWQYRAKIAKDYKSFPDPNDEPRPFRVESSGFTFELRKGMIASVKGNGLNLQFERWSQFSRYLTGGWFEEYTYLQFKPYEDAGVIKDLRLSIELSLARGNTNNANRWNQTYNEVDVAFTDGYALYIVECKAGNVTQEQIMKMQNIVRYYGGVEGHGILASCFPPNSDSVRRKIKDAKLEICCGDTFSAQIQSLIENITRRASFA